MVYAKAGTDRPFAHTNQILREDGLLEIQVTPREIEYRRRARIKLAGVSDDIAELLTELHEIPFKSRFELVPTVVIGDGSLRVLFTEPPILKRRNGSGLRV